MFYVSGDRHVLELFHNAYSWWRVNDLTAGTTARLADGELTSFFDGTTEYVFYIGCAYDCVNDSAELLHVIQLYYSSGKWWHYDLTAATKGQPPDFFGGLTGFFDGSIEHVFYLGLYDESVHELYLVVAPNFTSFWGDDDPTAAANSFPRCFPFNGYRLSSFFDGSTGHVFYGDQAEHVCELSHSNGKWIYNDLTAATNGPLLDSGVTGLFVP